MTNLNYIKTKTKFQVIFLGDLLTDSYVVGTYSTRMRARNKADKLDNEYGAYKYSVKAVEVSA
tara:strand:- start:490 stop:678 length:189 start_codon:yes stop_codon:yes gene_type:complete